MSNRVSMPAGQSHIQQGVKKGPAIPSNALIRQLLTNGSRNDAAALAAAQAERSDPESDIEPSDEDDEDKSIGGGKSGGGSSTGRAQLPRSALRSLVRQILGNVRTSPDAINCLNSAGARFVLAVSRRASRICEESGRSLITGDDLLRAISAIGCTSLVANLRQQFAQGAASSTAEQQEADASVVAGGQTKTKGRRPSEPLLGNVGTARKRRRGTTGGEGVDTEELQARQLALLMAARQADDLAAQQLETVQVEVTDDGHVEPEPGSTHLITSQNNTVVVTLPPSGSGAIVEQSGQSHYTAVNDADDYDT